MPLAVTWVIVVKPGMVGAGSWMGLHHPWKVKLIASIDVKTTAWVYDPDAAAHPPEQYLRSIWEAKPHLPKIRKKLLT